MEGSHSRRCHEQRQYSQMETNRPVIKLILQIGSRLLVGCMGEGHLITSCGGRVSGGRAGRKRAVTVATICLVGHGRAVFLCIFHNQLSATDNRLFSRKSDNQRAQFDTRSNAIWSEKDKNRWVMNGLLFSKAGSQTSKTVSEWFFTLKTIIKGDETIAGEKVS